MFDTRQTFRKFNFAGRSAFLTSKGRSYEERAKTRQKLWQDQNDTEV